MNIIVGSYERMNFCIALVHETFLLILVLAMPGLGHYEREKTL